MPIEQDPLIPRDEKVKYLEEWYKIFEENSFEKLYRWSSAENIIQDLKLKKDQFAVR